MLGIIASLDGFEIARILVKAAGYGTSLLAAGIVLFLVVHRGIVPSVERSTRRLAVAAALAALALVAGKVLAETAFLGGEWRAATDPALLGIVFATPLGDAAALRAVGLVLIVSLAFGTAMRWPAILGALAVIATFAMVGHTLREPRFLLGGLIMVHVAGIAYWIGALWPLHRAADGLPPAETGRLAQAFGRIALGVVAGLIVAGVVLFVLLTGDPLAAFQTRYGLFMLAKLALVVGLLGLAATNKLLLSPTLARGNAGAARKLKVAIGLEAGLMLLLLATVAAMTTLGGPGR